MRVYWIPRRLTLKANPPIYRWLRFNFGWHEIDQVTGKGKGRFSGCWVSSKEANGEPIR